MVTCTITPCRAAVRLNSGVMPLRNMHDVRQILGGAFRGMLEEQAVIYRALEPLNEGQRDQIVESLRAESQKIQRSICSSESWNARNTLLKFQYASRIIYDVDQSKDHMLKRFRWSMPVAATYTAHWSDGWSYASPTEEEFFQQLLEWLGTVDFYTQVKWLSDELYGLPIPHPEEHFSTYLTRSKISEESWNWRYESQIEEENKRWFTSQRKIDEIRLRSADHLQKSKSCERYIQGFYRDISPALKHLDDLMHSELYVGPRLHAAERAYAALKDGVRLKHLLLEDSSDLGKAYSDITRHL